MTPLLTGIYSIYNGSAALKAVLTGGLHLEVAPQGTSQPYATYFIVAGRPDYWFTKVDEYISVQFDIYASSDSARTAVYDALTLLYDDSRPSATGYTSIIMARTGQQLLREGDQNQIYRAIVEYQAIIEKAN